MWRNKSRTSGGGSEVEDSVRDSRVPASAQWKRREGVGVEVQRPRNGTT